MSSVAKVHKDGPDNLVVEAGGKISTPSGGVSPRVEKIALAADDDPGGLFAWENPEASKILVTRMLVHLTTETTGACTGDFGPAADGTTLNDTGIDGLDLNAASGLFDNIKNPGSNGQESFVVDEGDFVTGSVASGESAGIAGFVYIEYLPI